MIKSLAFLVRSLPTERPASRLLSSGGLPLLHYTTERRRKGLEQAKPVDAPGKKMGEKKQERRKAGKD